MSEIRQFNQDTKRDNPMGELKFFTQAVKVSMSNGRLAESAKPVVGSFIDELHNSKNAVYVVDVQNVNEDRYTGVLLVANKDDPGNDYKCYKYMFDSMGIIYNFKELPPNKISNEAMVEMEPIINHLESQKEESIEADRDNKSPRSP